MSVPSCLSSRKVSLCHRGFRHVGSISSNSPSDTLAGRFAVPFPKRFSAPSRLPPRSVSSAVPDTMSSRSICLFRTSLTCRNGCFPGVLCGCSKSHVCVLPRLLLASTSPAFRRSRPLEVILWRVSFAIPTARIWMLSFPNVQSSKLIELPANRFTSHVAWMCAIACGLLSSRASLTNRVRRKTMSLANSSPSSLLVLFSIPTLHSSK